MMVFDVCFQLSCYCKHLDLSCLVLNSGTLKLQAAWKSPIIITSVLGKLLKIYILGLYPRFKSSRSAEMRLRKLFLTDPPWVIYSLCRFQCKYATSASWPVTGHLRDYRLQCGEEEGVDREEGGEKTVAT